MKDINFKLSISSRIEAKSIKQLEIAIDMIKDELFVLKNKIIQNKSNEENSKIEVLNADIKLEFLRNWNLLNGFELE